MSRSKTYISRDINSVETSSKEPAWFSEFVANLDKTAVKSKKEDYSLFDQINSIVSNKSKYSSVEEAVLDMQKRTGLYDMLQKKQANANLAIFKDIPELKTFIDNYVEERPGTAIDAVVHDVLKIKSIKDALPEGDDVPEDVKHYINDKIMEAKTLHPDSKGEELDLGRLDLSTDDNVSSDNNPFGGCEPMRDK